MIDNNCRAIGLLTTQDYVNVGRLRTKGYKNSLLENGICVNESMICRLKDTSTTVDNFLDLENQIEEFIRQHNDMDALFAVNEIYAVTAMKALRKQGKEIPKDIQVIGFTDGVLSKHAFPPLTTVDQNGFEIGRISAKLLIQRLENEDSEDDIFNTTVVETQIIERDTTL